MILNAPTLDALADFRADICLIGAGPVGIVTALELSARGARVLLLESGGRGPQAAAQALSDHENLRPEAHHDPAIVVSRRLGGTSALWGGRCLPFDPVDFAAREWMSADADLPEWPIGPADLTPFEAAACRYLASGDPVWSEALPGVAADDAFGWESLERWSVAPRMQALHGADLAARENVMVALGATALGFEFGPAGKIAALDLHLEGPGRGRLAVGAVALCAGGNESTRILLAAQRVRSDLFGGADGPLGRYYMGHVAGQIADVTFLNPVLHDGLDFHIDAHGSYVRRRLVPNPATLAAERLANVAFWPVVPQAADPAHRSGALSAAFLALAAGPVGRRLLPEALRRKVVGAPPYHWSAHLRNVLCDPVRPLVAIPRYLWRSRVAKMRLPGFFLANPARRYGLEYHSEHLPNADSRLTLSEDVDRLGLPRLRIDLRFSEADAASVVRAHDALEDWLVRNHLAWLDYPMPRGARVEAVRRRAQHGTHQVGTIRMGADRRTAIVDRDCRAFDVPNLHVLSTAVLPTSGQANPTFTAVELALRFAKGFASGD